MSRDAITEKFWKIVEDALNDPENHATYYVGGTFCIDFPNGGVGLNLDGTGFSFNGGNLYMPKYINDKVKELYLKYKGETEHYKSEIERERNRIW